MTGLALFPAVAASHPHLGHRFVHGPEVTRVSAGIAGRIWYPWASRADVVRLLDEHCPEWTARVFSPRPLPGSQTA